MCVMSILHRLGYQSNHAVLLVIWGMARDQNFACSSFEDGGGLGDTPPELTTRLSRHVSGGAMGAIAVGCFSNDAGLLVRRRVIFSVICHRLCRAGLLLRP